ncbi:MAG TPA: fatty acid desaturase [Patescibacteria group bacterium]|nr:fatty acid desaturase [Patescibacteria group bacterium]
MPPASETPLPEAADWRRIVARFQKPSASRANWQIVNSVGSYALLWFLMYYTRAVSWWLTIPLALLAGMFLVRVFIIFHDCGHGSFFKSRRANNFWGFLCGLLTFTPFYQWRWEHSLHHASSGDLDRRGTGDIWTMTVQEYLEASRGKRFAYRLARNPFVLFVLAPLYVFLIRQRLPTPSASRRERHSVHWMNLALLGMAAVMTAIFGLKAYLIIQWTALMAAGSAGFWLFYVQHQFEGVYWERRDQWDYAAAALQGSSFYKLPRVLQWFSGNIGFHHIHHLSPRIPNYNLEKCHQADPLFQTVKAVTFFSSFKALRFRFWDEQGRALVGYRALRRFHRRSGQSV